MLARLPYHDEPIADFNGASAMHEPIIFDQELKISRLADEEAIHQVFLKRQDLLFKRSILSEEITRLDLWLLQHKPPLDILIAIWSRTMYCEYLLSADLNPAQKHLHLIRLRECYREFQKLPVRVQEVLFPIGWARWHVEFLGEEMREEACRGTA
jgi:hypothetical protein